MDYGLLIRWKRYEKFSDKEAIGAEGPFLGEFEFSAKSLTQVCLLFLSTDRYLHVAATEKLADDNMASIFTGINA